MRSLFSAISGMRSQMIHMDVVSNNIANVNTVGYKGARVTFSDMFSQMIREPSTPVAGGRGGTSATQVGLGVQVSGINVQMAQGNLMSTGKGTDVAIQGEGMFVMNDGNLQFFSRDGAFDLDAAATLVNVNTGMRVLGWSATYPGNAHTAPVIADDVNSLGPISIFKGMGKDGSGPGGSPAVLNPGQPTMVSFSIGANGAISGVYSDGSHQVIAQVAIASVTNAAGLVRTGQNNWRESLNSGAVSYGGADEPGRGSISSGTLEGSNIDLAQEFANVIIAQRGFQANTRVISAVDQIMQDLVNIVR